MTGELRQEIPPEYLLSPLAPEPRTLIDILYETAGRYPEAPAIDDGDVQLTYAELITDIEDSTLGEEFSIGTGDTVVGGMFAEPGDAAKVDALFAGVNCFFR